MAASRIVSIDLTHLVEAALRGEHRSDSSDGVPRHEEAAEVQCMTDCASNSVDSGATAATSAASP